MSTSGSSQVRLLLVEDVAQVAQYVRGLLNAQQSIKLLEVITDGTRVVPTVQQLRPDVVIVDALLQGRMKGPRVIEALHEAAPAVPVLVLTVPQNPIEPDPARGIDFVLAMPFSGYDLINRVQAAHSSIQESEAAAMVVAVFAPKGGVGKTTIAFNLAVGLSQIGRKTVLVDGSFQYSDLRTLLKVPFDAPSILDLPTDRIQQSDLDDVLWRDPSGIDILLAPPRVEMAEMVSVRDVEKTLSILRRVYQAVVVDTTTILTETTLAFLDSSDTILEIVTYDSTTIRNTVAIAEAFKSIGYPPAKVRYLVNRADSTGGINPDDLSRILGRIPEHSVVSDGRLVVQANNEGLPFVIANPEAPISRDILRVAGELTAAAGAGALVGARR